jgi:hypothetical protein
MRDRVAIKINEESKKNMKIIYSKDGHVSKVVQNVPASETPEKSDAQ